MSPIVVWPNKAALLDGDLDYRVYTGGHTPAPDRPAFVAFTRKYFDPR